MRAVITDPAVASRLRLAEVPQPDPAPDQALIKVEAFSLNVGEVRTALAAVGSYVPGWDFAGAVEKAAADGSTPPEGTRVFGLVPQGSWAEYVLAGAPMMAEIPVTVDSAQVAVLPVAGVTAMLGLESTGALLGRRVLITAAAGGVGRLACQLAGLAGADVFAASRRPAGAYDVILDGVGGPSLAAALSALAPGGLCVSFGNASGQPASFQPGEFYHTAGACLQGIWLGNLMLSGVNCTPVLTRLTSLVAQNCLRPPIGTVRPWTSVGEAAQRLARQDVNDKIVLAVQ